MRRNYRGDRVERSHKPRQIVRKDIEFEARTEGQQIYHNAIIKNDLVICDGPAGSSKTFTAVATALMLLRAHPDKFTKLVLVRPAVVVDGEDIGYLPGDADTKLRPFMMPMLDCAGHFLDRGSLQTLLDNGTIQYIPIAHLRGITLSGCIVIFDEAQNCRPANMKMFLTRIGLNCKAIVEGDMEQSDLRGNLKKENGLKWAYDRLDNIEGVELIEMGNEDIVRSPLVQRIISRLD
jgi:phosphate starvation-inducible PhoH-like protein